MGSGALRIRIADLRTALAAEHRPVRYLLPSRPFAVENGEPVSLVSAIFEQASVPANVMKSKALISTETSI
jgi:hypothetical protein